MLLSRRPQLTAPQYCTQPALPFALLPCQRQRLSLNATSSSAVASNTSTTIVTMTGAAWAIDKPGSLASLRLEQNALPPLAPGQALVAVRAIGLNFADVFSCLGLYAAFKGHRIPGLEFAGEVIDIAPPAANDAAASSATSGAGIGGTVSSRSGHGDDAAARGSSSASGSGSAQEANARQPPALKRGDRVMGVTRFGAFATHAALDAGYLMQVPAEWSYEQAAAYPVRDATSARPGP